MSARPDPFEPTGHPGEGDTGKGSEVSVEPTAADTDALRSEVEARAREAAEAQSRYLRTLADFDNYRKRVAREREDWRRQAQADLLREILAVLDNFDRALAAEPGPAGASGFRAGVELIHKDFLNALERVGVRPFASVGQAFDPQRHEAVGRVQRADLPDHTVVSEMLRGYLLQDRVLRPARVVVAVEPEAGAGAGEDAS